MRCSVLALAMLSTGCFVDAGDYVVFRVAVEETVISDGCFTEDNPRPVEDELSSNTFLTAGTWVIYYGAGDQVVLDTGMVSIGGEEDFGEYTFVGHSVDVDYRGIDNLEAKVTTTTETTIAIDQSGSAIQGDVVNVVAVTCDFLTATPSGGLCAATSDCETRAKFSGVELDDVALDSGVDRPNPL